MTPQGQCELRGFHRIALTDLMCMVCWKIFTPEEAVENERRKIARMEQKGPNDE